MANSRPLTGQASGSVPRLKAASEAATPPGSDPVWLTAGEAADAANATHGQVAAWVNSRVLSARTGWRGGAEIQLVLLSDLESLVEHVDLDRVRGSLAERGVFTGPRRVVLGAFTPDYQSTESSGEDSEAEKAGKGVVVRAAHSVRAEDRVWASELEGEVHRLRQVILSLRADHESLECHLDGLKSKPWVSTEAVSSAAVSSVAVAVQPLPERSSPSPRQDAEPNRRVTSGGLLAVAGGIVMGVIGAALIAPGAKTMAAEKPAPQSDPITSSEVALESAAPALGLEATHEKDAALAIAALDAMELDAPPGGQTSQQNIPTATVTGVFTAAFSPSSFGPAATAQNDPAGPFFEHFLTGDDEAMPSGITGYASANSESFRTAESTMLMGPPVPEYLRSVSRARTAWGRSTGPRVGSAGGTAVEASAKQNSAAKEVDADELMLVEPPPLRPRSRGVKPNRLGVPKRLQLPAVLADLDRSLFARRSALLNDCAYTPFVTFPAGEEASASGPSGALVLGPCFGPTREGQSGVIAVPGTHRVGSVSCCRHHAFVERMTAAALDEAARLGLRSEAQAALGEGVLPPLFRLRANRSATRFLREETRGWTSAGLDGIAGSPSAEDAIHEWRLTDDQPEGKAIRVELQSWIQPVVGFDPSKTAVRRVGSSRSATGMEHFRMVLLVQAAPDGDVLEKFEWLVD